MTNCDVINIRNSIITSEGTILLHLLESGIREIKRSPDTMKAAAILVSFVAIWSCLRDICDFYRPAFLYSFLGSALSVNENLIN